MSKKEYTLAEKASLRKTTRVQSFVLSVITGVLCLVVMAMYLFKIASPAGNESMIFKYLTAIVKNVLFVYLIYPIGWTLGVMCIITCSMSLHGRNVAKKMIKEAKKEEKRVKNEIVATRADYDYEQPLNGEEPAITIVEDATASAKEMKRTRFDKCVTVLSAILLAVVVATLLCCAYFSLKSYLPF